MNRNPFLSARHLTFVSLSLLAFPGWGVGGNDTLTLERDFVADFRERAVQNASQASASLDERSGGVSHPAVFLHPRGGEDAVLRFERVRIPDTGGRPFLLFHIGLRDGIAWEKGIANGVRFSIRLGDETVFEEAVSKKGWRAHAVDLSSRVGEEVDFEFRTDAIDGNSSYDWALFGSPLLVNFHGKGPPEAFEGRGPGVLLVRLKGEGVSKIGFRVGDEVGEIGSVAAPGWVQFHFQRAGEVTLTTNSKTVAAEEIVWGVHPPNVEIVDLALSTPLVTVGRPFGLLLTVKNRGLGRLTEPISFSIREVEGKDLSLLGSTLPEPAVLERLDPGAERVLQWGNLVASEPGDWALEAGDRTVSIHAFPAEPEVVPQALPFDGLSISPKGSVQAVLSNGASRVGFVTDREGHAYGILETWSGSEWQRLGSLYPIAELQLPGDGGEARTLPLRTARVSESENDLLLEGGFFESGAESGEPDWPVRIRLSAPRGTARLGFEYELTARKDAAILSFTGPTVSAGDRAFGVRKDFALFPGLEYLEGDEISSSTRDLAAPLNDRRAPAVHKIATPLMAVQGDEGLIGLLWDANQEWASGRKHPTARFVAPAYDSGREGVHLSLRAPSVGDFLEENSLRSIRSYEMKADETLRLEGHIVLDHRFRYDENPLVQGSKKGGLVLQAMRHWFEVYGPPEPSEQPRTWDEERALCRRGYFESTWNEDPPGWSHCHGWAPGLFVGHTLPLLLDIQAGVEDSVAGEIERRVSKVVKAALEKHGKDALQSPAGCHIVLGEPPFRLGYLSESLIETKRQAKGLLDSREEGLWVWRAGSEKHASLGRDGGHTLGQAARNALTVLRAARFTGDPELRERGLAALRQFDLHEVPRGGQMWECPMDQPDILPAGYAVRAYCEAFRMTGEERFLDKARYWAWTGLPFLYFWDLEGYPTMRYNTIAVIGSTFHTHSWIGLPVVWCGLVYAYGLQDLAEFDSNFEWKKIAQGITNSAMHQQYTEGASVGCFPDSWNMVKNTPNPADIGPEDIFMNELRLRGVSPEIRFARFGETVFLNSAADIADPVGSPAEGGVSFSLTSEPGFKVYSFLGQVPEPSSVAGAGIRVEDGESLEAAGEGWFHDSTLEGIVFRSSMESGKREIEVSW